MTKELLLKESVATLKAMLVPIFSKYIRYRDSGSDYIAKCYTCQSRQDVKYMQQGHFIGRTHLATMFDEKNNHTQCKNCNEVLEGNLDVYQEQLIKDYGEGIISYLQARMREFVKYDRLWYADKIIYYQGLVDGLIRIKELGGETPAELFAWEE